jgi:hypothetical protein
VVEDQQRKLQEELEKRSEELRKRLEQQSGAAPGATPAAATPRRARGPGSASGNAGRRDPLVTQF